VLFEGRVTSVQRATVGDFARGECIIQARGSDGERLRIEFQNENLVALKDDQVVGIVPAVICGLDADTAEPSTTEYLRYGLLVKVLVVSTPDLMRTPHAFQSVEDATLIDLVKRVVPGILGNPTVLIAICTDLQRCREVGARLDADRTRYIDVGTAAMNMLLVAQDLGLGACPVTSFSQRAVAMLLDLPATLIPELMVLLSHPVPPRRSLRPGACTRLTVEDLGFVATPDRGLQRLTSSTP
jgi:hypothetical protein